MWIVGVGFREGQADPLGRKTKSDILQLGLTGVGEIRTLQTYVIDGDLSEKNAEKIGHELLADGVTQFFNYGRFDAGGKHVGNLVGRRGVWAIEVFSRPGVMDPVGLSVAKAIEVLGISGISSVRTGTTFTISGDLEEGDVRKICEKSLANGLIQTYSIQRL
jgi:phosphoribosylformylglycinamidine (FGAM) synthase PurS component